MSERDRGSKAGYARVGMETFLEVSIILVLLVANGVFAMAEIAVVSARKARLRSWAEGGNSRARKALSLAESPNRFLSTVQIGITLVGIFAGAYGGARLAGRFAEYLETIPALANYAEGVAFGTVVVGITYLSLVIGELVPKRIGLGHPERIASFIAGPMIFLSAVAKPLVHLLSASTEGLMKILGIKPNTDTAVTEEEVKLLVREGLRVGVLHKSESEMVESVLALDQLPVKELMTPRAKIIWIHHNDPHETIWHKIVVSAHTTFPVYEEDRDHVLGLVSVKDIYAQLAAGIQVKIQDLVTPAITVPPNQTALGLLEIFKRSGKHIAIVIDEYGSVIGLVSLHDIMEAIAGDFPTMDARLRPIAKRRDDGSWLVDAMISIDEFAEAVKDFPLEPAGARDYSTLGGYIVKRFGRVPSEGESIQAGDYLVEVIDMDHHRIDKVVLLPARPKVEPSVPPPEPGTGASGAP